MVAGAQLPRGHFSYSAVTSNAYCVQHHLLGKLKTITKPLVATAATKTLRRVGTFCLKVIGRGKRVENYTQNKIPTPHLLH